MGIIRLVRAAAALTVMASCAAGGLDESSPAQTGEMSGVDGSDGGARAAGAALIVRVVDGDTVVVQVDGVEERLRIIGINSPEEGECGYAEATDRMSDLVAAGEVALLTDASDRDTYGRLLRYIEVEGSDVGEQLVAEGWALARRYEPDLARADRYDEAQIAAEASELGLWAPDACGDRDPAADVMRIETVEFDAPGDDGQNANGEWVVVANDGTESVDLSGWLLRDESASHRFTFPADYELAGGASVMVRSGCGDDQDATLHWCANGAVWNNSGDTAFLADPSGNIVDTYNY